MKPQTSARIVTTGIYALTRNPMYLGLALALLGLALWLSHPMPFGGVAVFIAYMNRFQIGPEEKILLDKFGQAMASYMEGTRRWL